MTDDPKRPKSEPGVPQEIVRKNAGAIERPIEAAPTTKYERAKSPPVEPAKDVPETMPIVMAPELPSSPLATTVDDSLPIRPEDLRTG